MTTETTRETNESNRPANRAVPEPVPETDDIDAEHRRAQQSGEVFAVGHAGYL